MKIADVLASAIAVAAVLLSAYAVGLLIRQARTADLPPQPQVVAETGAGVTPVHTATPAGAPNELAKNVAEQTVESKPQAPGVAGPNSLPPADKKLPKSGTNGRRGGKGAKALSPKERERLRQRLESMSDAERQSLKGRSQPQSGADRRPPRTDPSAQNADAEQDSEIDGSEPEENGQG